VAPIHAISIQLRHYRALKRFLNWNNINNRAEAIQKLCETWDSFPIAGINQLVVSFEERGSIVKSANGKSIQPFISAHKFEISPEYSRISVNPNICSPEEDNQLFLLVQRIGRKWTQISSFFQSEISNKYQEYIPDFDDQA
jgi:hypothetical protein